MWESSVNVRPTILLKAQQNDSAKGQLPFGKAGDWTGKDMYANVCSTNIDTRNILHTLSWECLTAICVGYFNVDFHKRAA